MALQLHKDHVRLRKEIDEQRQKSKDILNKYKPEQLTNLKNIDLYFLLDLQDYKRIEIPSSLLTRKYKERIMKYHPNYFDDRIFMALRNAQEILKDHFWKKKYDEFFVEEMNIEDKVYGPDIFFTTFDLFFKRMSIFSKYKPIPELGNMKTDKNKIQDFYKFWRNFESNRNFDFIGYNPNYFKMSDYEKSEHDMKYKKEKKDLFNEHVLYVRKVAQICQKNDPRIEREKIYVNPKLLVNGWTENDIILFERKKKKCQIGNKIDWKKFIKEFKMENGEKKTMRQILIKNTQIEKFRKEDAKENKQ